MGPFPGVQSPMARPPLPKQPPTYLAPTVGLPAAMRAPMAPGVPGAPMRNMASFKRCCDDFLLHFWCIYGDYGHMEFKEKSSIHTSFFIYLVLKFQTKKIARKKHATLKYQINKNHLAPP